MGEKIKTLAKGKILNHKIEIELNHPLQKGQDQQIHIQANNYRFEMDKKEFIKYALSILIAEKNLKNMKGIT